jgi:hypothetical protein
MRTLDFQEDHPTRPSDNPDRAALNDLALNIRSCSCVNLYGGAANRANPMSQREVRNH